MLGIHGEVAARPITIAGKNVTGFVPGLRLAPNREREFQEQNDEKRDCRRCEELALGESREFHGREVYLRDGRTGSRYVSAGANCGERNQGMDSSSAVEAASGGHDLQKLRMERQR